MKVAELKKYLDERFIKYPKNAKKDYLEKLVASLKTIGELNAEKRINIKDGHVFVSPQESVKFDVKDPILEAYTDKKGITYKGVAEMPVSFAVPHIMTQEEAEALFFMRAKEKRLREEAKVTKQVEERAERKGITPEQARSQLEQLEVNLQHHPIEAPLSGIKGYTRNEFKQEDELEDRILLEAARRDIEQQTMEGEEAETRGYNRERQLLLNIIATGNQQKKNQAFEKLREYATARSLLLKPNRGFKLPPIKFVASKPYVPEPTPAPTPVEVDEPDDSPIRPKFKNPIVKYEPPIKIATPKVPTPKPSPATPKAPTPKVPTPKKVVVAPDKKEAASFQDDLTAELKRKQEFKKEMAQLEEAKQQILVSSEITPEEKAKMMKEALRAEQALLASKAKADEEAKKKAAQKAEEDRRKKLQQKTETKESQKEQEAEVVFKEKERAERKKESAVVDKDKAALDARLDALFGNNEDAMEEAIKQKDEQLEKIRKSILLRELAVKTLIKTNKEVFSKAFEKLKAKKEESKNPQAVEKEIATLVEEQKQKVEDTQEALDKLKEERERVKQELSAQKKKKADEEKKEKEARKKAIKTLKAEEAKKALPELERLVEEEKARVAAIVQEFERDFIVEQKLEERVKEELRKRGIVEEPPPPPPPPKKKKSKKTDDELRNEGGLEHAQFILKEITKLSKENKKFGDLVEDSGMKEFIQDKLKEKEGKLSVEAVDEIFDKAQKRGDATQLKKALQKPIIKRGFDTLKGQVKKHKDAELEKQALELEKAKEVEKALEKDRKEKNKAGIDRAAELMGNLDDAGREDSTIKALTPEFEKKFKAALKSKRGNWTPEYVEEVYKQLLPEIDKKVTQRNALTDILERPSVSKAFEKLRQNALEAEKKEQYGYAVSKLEKPILKRGFEKFKGQVKKIKDADLEKQRALEELENAMEDLDETRAFLRRSRENTRKSQERIRKSSDSTRKSLENIQKSRTRSQDRTASQDRVGRESRDYLLPRIGEESLERPPSQAEENQKGLEDAKIAIRAVQSRAKEDEGFKFVIDQTGFREKFKERINERKGKLSPEYVREVFDELSDETTKLGKKLIAFEALSDRAEARNTKQGFDKFKKVINEIKEREAKNEANEIAEALKRVKLNTEQLKRKDALVKAALSVDKPSKSKAFEKIKDFVKGKREQEKEAREKAKKMEEEAERKRLEVFRETLTPEEKEAISKNLGLRGSRDSVIKPRPRVRTLSSLAEVPEVKTPRTPKKPPTPRKDLSNLVEPEGTPRRRVGSEDVTTTPRTPRKPPTPRKTISKEEEKRRAEEQRFKAFQEEKKRKRDEESPQKESKEAKKEPKRIYTDDELEEVRKNLADKGRAERKKMIAEVRASLAKKAEDDKEKYRKIEERKEFLRLEKEQERAEREAERNAEKERKRQEKAEFLKQEKIKLDAIRADARKAQRERKKREKAERESIEAETAERIRKEEEKAKQEEISKITEEQKRRRIANYKAKVQAKKEEKAVEEAFKSRQRQEERERKKAELERKKRQFENQEDREQRKKWAEEASKEYLEQRDAKWLRIRERELKEAIARDEELERKGLKKRVIKERTELLRAQRAVEDELLRQEKAKAIKEGLAEFAKRTLEAEKAKTRREKLEKVAERQRANAERVRQENEAAKRRKSLEDTATSPRTPKTPKSPRTPKIQKSADVVTKAPDVSEVKTDLIAYMKEVPMKYKALSLDGKEIGRDNKDVPLLALFMDALRGNRLKEAEKIADLTHSFWNMNKGKGIKFRL